jgi:hypothetical protein
LKPWAEFSSPFRVKKILHSLPSLGHDHFLLGICEYVAIKAVEGGSSSGSISGFPFVRKSKRIRLDVSIDYNDVDAYIPQA